MAARFLLRAFDRALKLIGHSLHHASLLYRRRNRVQARETGRRLLHSPCGKVAGRAEGMLSFAKTVSHLGTGRFSSAKWLGSRVEGRSATVACVGADLALRLVAAILEFILSKIPPSPRRWPRSPTGAGSNRLTPAGEHDREAFRRDRLCRSRQEDLAPVPQETQEWLPPGGHYRSGELPMTRCAARFSRNGASGRRYLSPKRRADPPESG